ncbi:serine hydrolase [Alistipes sp.]|uniref:serine hydrolase n=1 Tax=Alistipes sp. TaxID=1872444 RepID=UPI0025C19A17|nr:serine hydrolase [Alistipes sp.]
MKRRILLLCALLAWEGILAQQLPRVAPEQAGLDSRQLVHADRAIEQAIAEHEIPGAVLAVVKDGKMAYLKAYGNRRTEPYAEPMTTSTIFDMASCSKAMSTSVCAMILVERGLVRLQDPVSRYIEGFRDWESEDGKSKRTIRVQDLMTHSSGLPAYASVPMLVEKYGALNAGGLMEYIATCPREFEPRTDFCYSCLNYIALQHVIEQASGESLRTFARKNLFDVLGMDHTDYLPCRQDRDGNWVNTSDAHWAPLVEGDWHSLIAPTEEQPNGQILCGQVHDPLARVMNGGVSGNASLFSSAEDIALLCAALQNGGSWNGRRILSPMGVRAMRSIPREVSGLGRTLGWDCCTAYASANGSLFGLQTYSHTGYTGTSIVIDPESNLSVILLTNQVHPHDEHSVVRLRTLVSNVVAASLTGDPVEEMAPYTEHYYKRIVAFMDERPVTRDDIVMLGNSLTENGGDWSARLEREHVVNRGIIGDEAMGVYDRLHLILPSQPAKIFLMIGVNDLSHDLTSEEIARRVEMIVERIRQESPATKLHVQSLLPFNESFRRYKRLDGKEAMVAEINTLLKAVAKRHNAKYIDLYPLFCTKGGHTLPAEYTTDGLHLNEEGYRIWAKALRKYL